jgi:hypothetical protein
MSKKKSKKLRYTTHSLDKFNKSKNKEKGLGSYVVYYNGHSIDIFGVYSPKAAIRKCRKLIEKGEI